MKRRSQGRTSVVKDSSPAPPGSPAASKREHPEDGQQKEDAENPLKRQRLDPPPDPNENGDRTLVQEAEETTANAATSPLTSLPDNEANAHASPKPMRSSSPEEPAPMRHVRFWYDDGSVVVHVQPVLFRLHKSLLSIHSTYFQTLFANQDRPAASYDAGSGITLPLYTLDPKEIEIEGLCVSDFEQLLEVLEKPHAKYVYASHGRTAY